MKNEKNTDGKDQEKRLRTFAQTMKRRTFLLAAPAIITSAGVFRSGFVPEFSGAIVVDDPQPVVLHDAAARLAAQYWGDVQQRAIKSSQRGAFDQ